MKYTGIGSRETPFDIQVRFTRTAQILASCGYTLRSGGAKEGADPAFEAGAGAAKEIFLPKDVPLWAFEEVQKHLPKDRKWENYRKQITRALVARDMQQVLGEHGDDPSEFVACWTKDGKDTGGTGYAIRCATAHGIKIYNVRNAPEREAFGAFLRSLRRNHGQR